MIAGYSPAHDGETTVLTIGATIRRMLILAIDTALEACAAAVLDTEAGRCSRRNRCR